MEKWKKEILALEEKRKGFGLSFYQMQLLTGVNRQQLKKIFEFVNIPSIKLFFEVKEVLDNYKSVNDIEVRTTTDETSFEEKGLSLKKVKTKCECKIVDGLLRRGKDGCKKSKSEHKF